MTRETRQQTQFDRYRKRAGTGRSRGGPALDGAGTEWASREPRAREVITAIGAALRRGWARMPLTLALAIVVAMGVGANAARDVAQPARVVVRISETAVSGSGVLGRADLRNWLMDAALSSQRLLTVIDAWQLYPGPRSRGPDQAVEALRDDMQLEVFANYFLVDRATTNQLRSARVAIGYTAADPEVAVGVALALAETMVAFEHQLRREASQAELAVAERGIERARALLDAREGELAAATQVLQTRTGDRASAQVAVLRLAEATRAGKALYDAMATQRAQLALRTGAAEGQLAQRFDIAGVERPRTPRMSAPQRAMFAGAAALVIALPLCAIAVGAFDNRIRCARDLGELDLSVLAWVPRLRRQASQRAEEVRS
jgi:hypothetical protein